MTEMSAFTLTQARQWEASDPRISAFVVANAGSGKTHVLTSRVVRLLLDGTPPGAILCLTFTKAAAAEMSRRIFDVLGKWATLPDDALVNAIADLQGVAPPAAGLAAARRLFGQALETPGGLKIQTIHAFCERLLHQFPFEANVPAHFSVLDEAGAAALKSEARADVLMRARDGTTSLGRAFRRLADAPDATIEAALDAVVDSRDALAEWAGSCGGAIEDALADLRRRLKVAPRETEADVCREICAGESWSHAECARILALLEQALEAACNRNGEWACAALRRIRAARDPIAEADARLEFFAIRKDGAWAAREPKNRFSAAFRKAQARLDDDFRAETERLIALAERLAAIRTVEATEALLIVGDAILTRYQARKSRAGLLDYDDLIGRARDLLARSNASQWVLYKLDPGIRHILVDEAQDTSPAQWAIVTALAQEFFAGEGSGPPNRTLFAVGDDKQSIYGFQGAEPRMMAEMEARFRKAAEGIGAGFVKAPLFLSFRSTSEVLAAVDRVFTGERAERVAISGYEAHSARRHAEPGRVIVWPRIVNGKVEVPEDWTAPFDVPSQAEVRLADEIADEIARLLEGGPLPSAKPVRPGQILILTRKRGAFATAMNRALKARRLPAAGSDRIALAEHIAVLDLLALADVMLLPDDDLQLATVLKSPLVGLSDDELMALAVDRGPKSLWSALRAASAPRFQEAHARLARWRAMADFVPPFDFFARVLGPGGGRRAIRARLGAEADDVLDAFLSRVAACEILAPPTLQGLLAQIRAGEGDIKREVEEAAGAIRVMTVHGAKGLEADIVFLVDTGGAISHVGHRSPLAALGGHDGALLVWRRGGADATPLQRAAERQADDEASSEYLRLLYVGMTRAADLLYVCGIKGERTPENCWHGIVERALAPEEAARDAETGELAAPCCWPPDPRPPVPSARPVMDAVPDPVAVPDWLRRAAPPAPEPPRPLRPSRALAEPDEPDPDPPGEAPPEAALLHGRLVHRLLEALAGIEPESRRAVGEAMLAREAPDGGHDSALRQALGVLEDPALRVLFGAGSRGEVAIAGTVPTASGAFAVSGRIDRLVVDRDAVRLVDFKAGRPPADVEEIEPAQLLQLALYRRLVARLYGDRPVRAAFVFTSPPRLTEVPDALLERALAGIDVLAEPALPAGVP